jgi:hypothetical protein
MILKKILSVFPPPEFLDLPYAGLAISDACIRCVRFKKDGEVLSVAAHKEIPLPPGAVLDGQIADKAAMLKLLEELKKDLKLEYVRASLPEEKAYLFTMKIPVVPEEDIRSSIEFKIEENVPLPASELEFDYELVDPEHATDHLDVVVSAIPTSLAVSYADIIRNAGLSLLSLEIVSQAVARAVIPSASASTFLILHFGAEKAGMYVVNEGVVQFTSTVSIPSITPDPDALLFPEIAKLYAYWDTLKKNLDRPDRKISGILVSGEGFDEGLVSRLGSQHDVPVRLADVWSNVCDIEESVPPIPFSDSFRYASAIGLALPSDVLI